MTFKLDDIEEAKTETEHRVEIPFGSNGDKRVLEVYYRPITPTIMMLPLPVGLAKTIIRWNAEEEPTLELLSGRPVPFLKKISEAIETDFFPVKSS